MANLPRTTLGLVWLISLLGICLAALGLLAGSGTLYYTGSLLAAPIYLVILPIAVYVLCHFLVKGSVAEILRVMMFKNPVIDDSSPQESEEDVELL